MPENIQRRRRDVMLWKYVAQESSEAELRTMHEAAVIEMQARIPPVIPLESALRIEEAVLEKLRRRTMRQEVKRQQEEYVYEEEGGVRTGEYDTRREAEPEPEREHSEPRGVRARSSSPPTGEERRPTHTTGPSGERLVRRDRPASAEVIRRAPRSHT